MLQRVALFPGPALAQEPLELAREDVARREVARVGTARLLVGGALEALHEGLDVRVELDRLGHLRLVLDRGVVVVRVMVTVGVPPVPSTGDVAAASAYAA